MLDAVIGKQPRPWCLTRNDEDKKKRKEEKNPDRPLQPISLSMRQDKEPKPPWQLGSPEKTSPGRTQPRGRSRPGLQVGDFLGRTQLLVLLLGYCGVRHLPDAQAGMKTNGAVAIGCASP